MLLGSRWRRKADREGTFAPFPPLVPNRDSVCLPLVSLPSPSLCGMEKKLGQSIEPGKTSMKSITLIHGTYRGPSPLEIQSLH